MPDQAHLKDITQQAAEIIDPMAWAAWEIDLNIESRRKMSLIKAAQILALKAAAIDHS